MAMDTVNKRRSGINLGLFGINRLLFIPLNPDNEHTTDDGENALGIYIGFVISTISAGEGEIVSAVCRVIREISKTCPITRERSKTCEFNREVSATCTVTKEVSATTIVDG